MKKALFLICLAGVIALASWTCIHYYSYLFARTVYGEVQSVEKLTQTDIGTVNTPAATHVTFSIAIKDKIGETFTATTDDRQWAAVSKGDCVQAKYFRYPPWDYDRAGTYFGARLKKLFDCKHIPST